MRAWYSATRECGSALLRGRLAREPAFVASLGRPEGLLEHELANSHTGPKPDGKLTVVDHLKPNTTIKTRVDDGGR